MSGRSRALFAPAVGYPERSQAPQTDAINGQKAFAALANSEGQNAGGGLGPATSIGLTSPGYTPVVSGNLFISGFMHVIDAAPGGTVSFILNVAGFPVALSAAVSDASGNAFASFSVIVSTTVNVPVAISLTASAGANLTSPAQHQALNIIELT